MKKLLALILALLMLCACAAQEEPITEEPIEETSEPKVEFFTAANGKSGAKLDGEVIIEPEYSVLELYDDFILAKNEYVFRLFGYDGVQRGFDYDYFRYDWDTDIAYVHSRTRQHMARVLFLPNPLFCLFRFRLFLRDNNFRRLNQ